MSVARFIADQRTNYRVPHTITCVLLGVSLSWFYKWRARPPTPRQQRRAELDAAVAAMFADAKGAHGSPRLHADLRDAGWIVTEKTVADSMRRQGLVARKVKRRRGLTKQDKTAPKFPDLVNRDFTATGAEPEVVRRHHRDPHRRREAVPGHGDRSVLPPAAGRRRPVCAATRSCASRRSRSPPRSAAARTRSTTWCSTPTADRPIPPDPSPGSVLI